jgi:hypothetical protein
MLSSEVFIVLAVLSVYRISEMISIDDGPFHVFDRMRRFLGRIANRNELFTTLADLVHCPFCVGFWISILFAFLFIFRTIAGDIFTICMGIAGGQTILETLSKNAGSRDHE